MNKCNIVFEKKLILFFLLIAAVALFNPHQSIAQPQKFDGTKAYVTIWFDHAFADQVPAVDAMVRYHIPGAILVRTGVVGNHDYMTWDQLHYYNSLGFEMIDHSVTHPIITNNTSLGRLVHEILFSKAVIQENGFKLIGYLSPYDIITPQSAFMINQHFKYTVIPSTTQNTLDTIKNKGKPYGFSIPTLQHLGVGFPPGPPLNNFAEAKAAIDYAVDHHTWIVLNYHQLDDKNISYHAKLTLFMHILDYLHQKINAKEMVAVTPSVGLGLE